MLWLVQQQLSSKNAAVRRKAIEGLVANPDPERSTRFAVALRTKIPMCAGWP